MEFLKRWYDTDPRMSLAVGCLEKASPLKRRKIAQHIILKAKSYNVVAKEPPPVFFKRWYDKDRALSLAMEYLRNIPNAVK